MELKVRGWSRHKRKPPQTLKEVSLRDDAKIGGSIYHSETRITVVPKVYQKNSVQRVRVDFGVNLTKFGGDYLASLHLSPSDIKLLYELCFGIETVSPTRRGVDKAAEDAAA